MGVPKINVPKTIASAKSAVRSGDLVRARQLFEDVLARFPANKRARDGLAMLERDDPRVGQLLTLWNAGKVKSALDLSEQLSVAHPTVRDIRAASFRALGQPEAAIALYDEALKREPRNPNLWFNAGGARLEAHRLTDAAHHLKQAVTLDPSATHFLTLAHCRWEQGYHAEVVELTERVEDAKGASPALRARARSLAGKALLQLGRVEAAEAALAEALISKPDDPDALYTQGMAAAARGDTPTARAHYEMALSHEPTRTDIHRSLARLTSYTADHPHLAQMQGLVERGLPPTKKVDLHFALFKAFDDIGAPEVAFDHLQAGNSTRRNVLRYAPDRDAALFARLTELDVAPLERATGDDPRPIFVVGLPRSGTTLTERVLAGVPGTVAGGELSIAGQGAKQLLTDLHDGVDEERALRSFADTITDGFKQIADASSVLIDKMPLNFRWVEFLLAALPDARVVWLDRDPLANACSLYTQCFAGSGNRFAYDADDIAAMLRHERGLRAKLTARWPDRIHVLSLHDMTQTPEPIIRNLVSFCDLDWSDDCLSPHKRGNAVLTASAQQVHQPLSASMPGATNMNPLCRAHIREALERHDLTG